VLDKQRMMKDVERDGEVSFRGVGDLGKQAGPNKARRIYATAFTPSSLSPLSPHSPPTFSPPSTLPPPSRAFPPCRLPALWIVAIAFDVQE
jgi:hypothetical protein